MKEHLRARDLARVSTKKCDGCGDCCHNMDDTIVLDPYDIYIMSEGLHMSFNQMISDEASKDDETDKNDETASSTDIRCIELSVVNKEGLILPHLKMTPVNENLSRCVFLRDDGRCGIHLFRPGLCRLFPLGRQFEEDRITYFVLDACDMPGKSKVRISDYIGIPDFDQYERYKLIWHRFTKQLTARLGEFADDDDQQAALDNQRKLNFLILHIFYSNSYDSNQGSFYEIFESRMKRVNDMMGF